MGALYKPTVDDDIKPLIYALDEDDAWEILNRWYNNPEQARIQLHEEQDNG